MKALCIRQPWAWLIAYGPKRIENRSWRPKFRGDFFIHASAGMSRREYRETIEYARAIDPRIAIPVFDYLERGGIIGRARVVDVIPPCYEKCPHPWHIPGRFGLVLADVQPLPFRALPGRLGFFEVD